MTTHATIPTASVADTVRIFTDILIPTVAKGPIIRRPKMVAMAERLKLDSRAVRRMQSLHETYGNGPLRVRVPGWSRAVILDPEHVHEVLERSPEPFATETDEKRAALSHFEPKVSLISHGAKRADRRQLNEQVLDTYQSVHKLADDFLPVVHEESSALLEDAQRDGELTWNAFNEAWFRVVRRVVFGDSARNDHELTNMIAKLRSNGNWAFFKPKQKELREQFLSGVPDRIVNADPGSLCNIMAKMHTTEEMAPSHQVPQWLFAFDPAGMATFRTLALLASHSQQAEQAQQEIANDTTGRKELPYLRSCVLESLRLWPTTPLVLRQTTAETEWETGTMPADTGILIFAPYFHRDDRNLSYADRFSPEVWQEERTSDDWPLIPFSGGPAICPGTQLVLLLTSAMLADLIDGREIRTTSSNRLDSNKPIPGTLNNYALRFAYAS